MPDPLPRAQNTQEILAQAHIEHSGAGEAHTVAALAKVMRHWRDEAEPSAGFALGHIAGRAAGAMVAFIQRPAPAKPAPHHGERQISQRLASISLDGRPLFWYGITCHNEAG